jgi:predicted nucleic acid-binding protein
MKTYWDSSAVIEAVMDAEINRRLRRERGVTRPHTLAETFSTLTGNPDKRIDADDAALVVASLAESLDFVELTAREMIEAMKRARRVGVRGGRVHDFMHAVAAEKSGAGKILTLDRNDFIGLTGIAIECLES